ncbi:uncharacterized protein [Halyomorpha halys]|uniref:uncharacterized protein isoform X1 n=2 Tax=Halyomorpha halys TaxID=286706 RepID=UPI0034D1FD1E
MKMKLTSTKVCLFTLILLVMNHSIMTQQINDSAFIDEQMEPEKKFDDLLPSGVEEIESNFGTKELYNKDESQNDDNTYNIDQDLAYIKDIIQEFGGWILSKLDDDLRKKLQSKLEDKNLAFDSSLWKDFSDDDIKSLKNAVLETLSPFLEPVIENIAVNIPKNIFDIQEFFNFSKKDEL